MKALIVALTIGVLSFFTLSQPASAGIGFEICAKGVCIGKPNREDRHHRWGPEHRRSWQEYCYHHRYDDYRCDPYRYRRPPPQNCFYSPDYGWECY